jgi:hypothetical protein
VQALEYLEDAEKLYRKLADDCAGDSVWEPEALYSIAIIEETRALRKKDREQHLEKALSMYKRLAADYKDSAHGKMAKKRAQLLENKEKATEIANFYADLEDRFQVERRFLDAEIQRSKKKGKE